jgi:hypothetical protein
MLPRLARRAQRRLGRPLSSLPAQLLDLQSAISPAVCAQLEAEGFAVVDGAVRPEAVGALREEILGLRRQGLLHANCTHLVKDNATQLLPKAHIHEAELSMDARVAAAAPLLARVDADRTLATLLSLFLPQLSLDSQVGWIRGAGGACCCSGGGMHAGAPACSGPPARRRSAAWPPPLPAAPTPADLERAAAPRRTLTRPAAAPRRRPSSCS